MTDTTESWMVVNRVPTMSVKDFALAHGLALVVTERRQEPPSFTAQFKHAEVMERGMLSSRYGDGSTPTEAIADYARQISLTRLAIRAYTDERREIEVPRLTA